MQSRILDSMQSTSVRIDVVTHERLKQLAGELDKTVGETVAFAIGRLIQQQMGQELATPLTDEELEWLDADLG